MWLPVSQATKQHLWWALLLHRVGLQFSGGKRVSQDSGKGWPLLPTPLKKKVYVYVSLYLGLLGCLHEAHVFFISKSTLPVRGFTLHRWQFHPALVFGFWHHVLFLPSWFWHLWCFLLLSLSLCSPASSFTTRALRFQTAGWLAGFVDYVQNASFSFTLLKVLCGPTFSPSVLLAMSAFITI